MAEPGVDLMTERLILRPVSLTDTDLYLALDNDPAVKQFIDGGKPALRSEVEATIASATGHRWSGFSNDDDSFVGWFSLTPEADGERQLGYRLVQTAWGQGLATEGSHALVEHGFTTLGVNRIWAQTMAVNTGSRRVMEKCGLAFVRTFFEDWPDVIDGSEHGDVLYEAHAETWTPS